MAMAGGADLRTANADVDGALPASPPGTGARMGPEGPRPLRRQGGRERLLRGPLRSTLRAVVSGHTHQALDVTEDGVRHLWIPSSGFVIPDEMQARVGEKVVGIGLLELEGRTLRFDLWCPDGMLRHDLSLMPAFHALESPARIVVH